ncbi:uncharacterized protein LOC127791212 [Diospyros lotus]|uniref:uncharacterized protein LOC127791212 n=1 Tax=Diospyros lotus TaxID=55363 RepID=UPI002254BC83|nr:uncharacterized protein LOC127791212 [Diospyros lotus]
MATLSSHSLLKFPSLSPFTSRGILTNLPILPSSTSSRLPRLKSHRFSAGGSFLEQEGDHAPAPASFEEAVRLFNGGDYYECHDVLEALWNDALEPSRTLFHAILQCAVGFHHLFNKNHKGAMMELGEGLCKLRKMNFEGGPFLRFEQEISAVLDFIYQTQLELAACTDHLCLALDQSERSYQLLGGYAAGQNLYSLQSDPNETLYIVFCPERYVNGSSEPPRVKLPVLHASEEHLMEVDYN